MKRHLDTIMVISYQLLCQKWMHILFREYPQHPVLYCMYKAWYWNLTQTMKTPSSVDDAEYILRKWRRSSIKWFNFYSWTDLFVLNYNKSWRNQPGTVILYGHYLGWITTSQPTIWILEKNYGYIDLAVTHTRWFHLYFCRKNEYITMFPYWIAHFL